VALTLRLAMAWAIPLANGSDDPNCAPDESAHFQFTKALSHGRAPTWPDRTDSIYAAFLPTPYLLHAAALAALGERADVGRFRPAATWARGYEAARLGSVVLSALTALTLMLAAGVWTRSRVAALAVGLAASLYPQLTFVGAYTNADAFTMCVGALHVLALLRWATGGEGSDGLMAVGVTGGLVVLGKMSGYYLLPATGAWVTWAVLRRRIAPSALGSALGAFAAVCVPVLAWNAWRNGGDVLGLQRYHRFLAEVWLGEDGRQVADAWRSFSRMLPRSAFGVFKNMGLLLPERIYQVALALLVSGLVAGALLLRRASETARRGALWLIASVFMNLALVVYNCWFVDFQPQGRYVLLSALLLSAVALWAPTRLLPPGLRWCWPIACLLFLAVAAGQAQVIVYRRPSLPRPAAMSVDDPEGAARRKNASSKIAVSHTRMHGTAFSA
jgi:4-amino-4-deoxy-L-arabinose transferase-like glycosyltransferase